MAITTVYVVSTYEFSTCTEEPARGRILSQTSQIQKNAFFAERNIPLGTVEYGFSPLIGAD